MASQNEVKMIIENIKDNKENEQQRVNEDLEKYLVYNGQLRRKISNIIVSEFKDPNTITELTNRIVPINITQKIVDKLSGVYRNGAERRSLVDDIQDQELIDIYSRSFMIDKTMMFCNKMTKLTKHSLLEPYLDKKGIPKLRVLPSHTFSLYSNDPINPEKATSVIKHIRIDTLSSKNSRFAYWDEQNHWIIDGDGNIQREDMDMMGNPEGINPFGTIPFVHTTQQDELLYPIRSNDIMSVQIAVCLLLSDSTLAQKYLSWATLVLSGVEGEQKVKVGPAAILSLPKSADGQNPDAKYIQPALNSDEVIRLVEKLVEFVLTTNNLSAGTVIGKLTTSNAASGISKMFDSIESTEDINQQRSIYANSEEDLWDKFAHNMLPYWVQTGVISPDFIGAFSPDFKLSIKYPEVKPMLSKKERIENAKLELELGATSLKRAIKSINPEMEDIQIEELILNIQKEKVEMSDFFERNMNGSKESQS